MGKTARIVWCLQFVTANALFVYQGGFGAGHGPLDGPILLAGLPGLLLAWHFDQSLIAWFDSVWVVAVGAPALFNAGIYTLNSYFWKKRGKRQASGAG